MKLSISGKVSSLLNQLQVSHSQRVANAFPGCVSPEYMPLWDEFLQTASAKAIIKRYGVTKLTTYYLASLFVSYLSRFSKVKYPIASEALYQPASNYRFIVGYCAQTKLLSRLNLGYYSHSYTLQAEDSEWLRCLSDPVCHGMITYKVSGRKPLDAYLNNLVPGIVRSVPAELRSDGQRSSSSTVPKRPSKLLHPSKQALSSTGWVPLLDENGVTLFMSRALYGTVLLRYSFTTVGLFPYADAGPTDMGKRLRKAHESSVLLPK